MSYSSFLKNFTLFYIIINISIGIISSLLDIRVPSSTYMISTTFLINYLLSKYLIDKKIILEGKLYWKTFGWLIFIQFTYSLLSIILVSYIAKFLTVKIIFVALMIVIFYHIIATFMALWLANRQAKKALGMETKTTKLYSVTDEIIGNHLLKLLKDKKIEATLKNNYINHNSITTSLDRGGIDIMIYHQKDSTPALKIIDDFFKNQKEIEAWRCPKCHSSVDKGFSTCWNCQHEKETIEKETIEKETIEKETIEKKTIKKEALEVEIEEKKSYKPCIECGSTQLSFYPKYYQCDECKRRYRLR